jgi:hypothetical protein
MAGVARHGAGIPLPGGCLPPRHRGLRERVILNPLDSLPPPFNSVGAKPRRPERSPSRSRRSPTTSARCARRRGSRWRTLPCEAGLAAITGTPQRSSELRTATTRSRWDVSRTYCCGGGPLDVSSLADRVIIAGAEQPMRSWQAELRDRYRAVIPPPCPFRRRRESGVPCAQNRGQPAMRTGPCHYLDTGRARA